MIQTGGGDYYSIVAHFERLPEFILIAVRTMVAMIKKPNFFTVPPPGDVKSFASGMPPDRRWLPTAQRAYNMQPQPTR